MLRCSKRSRIGALALLAFMVSALALLVGPACPIDNSPVTLVQGTISLQALKGLCGGRDCTYEDLEVIVSGMDGSMYTASVDPSDGSFKIEIRIVDQFEFSLIIVNANTGATIAVLVFEVDLSGMQELLIPATTPNGQELMITLGTLDSQTTAKSQAQDFVQLSASENPYDELDTDGDGQSDYVDTDDDGDGIPDVDDDDRDGNGIPDDLEAQDIDPDGDFVPNDVDDDDDNDGIPDDIDTDDDGDGIPDVDERDLDGDGIPDEVDVDMDNDGDRNDEDMDDDNDGIPDDEELDTDGDGIPDDQDADIDGDGQDNVEDADDDGDGIPDDSDTDHCSERCDASDDGEPVDTQGCDCNTSDVVVRGEISALDADAGTFVVNSITILTDDNTEYKEDLHSFADLAVGAFVEVRTTELDTGEILAISVESKNPDEEETTFEASGLVTSLDSNTGTLTLDTLSNDQGPIPIQTDGNTEYRGSLTDFSSLALDMAVEVKGDVLPDGSYLATSIKDRDGEEN
ncbi:MAG: hypothetical protein D6795_20345 [Deltaproteobacteria bacterium]|nr:MAG: hypothetical protein D6795_20345 [Deltaproteobacteria bacterium]